MQNKLNPNAFVQRTSEQKLRNFAGFIFKLSGGFPVERGLKIICLQKYSIYQVIVKSRAGAHPKISGLIMKGNLMLMYKVYQVWQIGAI